MGGINRYLAAVDGNRAMACLEKNGTLDFDVDGTPVSLTRDDLLIDVQ